MSSTNTPAPRRKRLLGYADRMTVRPLDKIDFKISSEGNIPYIAQMVRLINGDTQSGDHFKEVEIDSSLNGRYEGRWQPILSGSYVSVDNSHRLDRLAELTIAINVMPTTPQCGSQHLISRWNDNEKCGWSLCIDERGRLMFIAGDGSGPPSTLAVSVPLQAKTWYAAAVRVSWLTREVTIDWKWLRSTSAFQLEGRDGPAHSRELCQVPAELPPLLMAAAFGGCAVDGRIRPVGCFNGRLEAPVIYRSRLSEENVAKVMAGERPSSLMDRVAADWDFADGVSGTRITDRSPSNLQGRTHNLPLRAVRGSRWNGSTLAWRHAPDQYAAIHFHSDDLYDCAWLTDVTYTVPENLPSGIYALRIRPLNEEESADEEYLPFFVAAPKGKPRSKIAFLAPTFSYLAYGNVGAWERFRNAARLSPDQYYDDPRSTVNMIGPGTRDFGLLVAQHPELGGSTYDYHADGSPVHFSSWLRPLLNLRPKTLLWTFCADLLLIDWLEAKSFDYDVITDDLLHAEGVDLLSQYTVVLSGNHPEYHTTQTLDAIEAYLGGGGRFMYLGGNGFYWRIGVHRDLPGVIEVRRGITGTGAWVSETGEFALALTGEMGGLWRDAGRPPQRLFGVGFIAQGLDPSYYRITPGARQSRAAFILKDVEGDIIGDFGIYGGAAGQEIDNTSGEHGTPGHAIVVARSENHGPGMLFVIEEMRIPLMDRYRSRISAEVTFFETGHGGAVFAVGSMAWCGSLGHNSYDNNISRITSNVLKRFCNTEPFV